jgi:hypothetical protein
VKKVKKVNTALKTKISVSDTGRRPGFELQRSEDLDGDDVVVQKKRVGAAQRSLNVQKDRGDQILVRKGQLRSLKIASVKKVSLTATMKNETMKVQTASPHPSRVSQPSSLCGPVAPNAPSRGTSYP